MGGTAVDRIRHYLSRKGRQAPSSTAAAALEPAAGNPNSTSRRGPLRSGGASPAARRAAAAQGTPAPRRRLQRGWWPDTQKRAERSFRAMELLKNETFVITEEHLEWAFDQSDEEGPLEPQCHLLLPSGSAAGDKKGHCSVHVGGGWTSNECLICMAEYDVGNVVVYSRNCPHAFHQDCILDWLSRENDACPCCRAQFYDPEGKRKAKKRGTSPESEDETGETEVEEGGGLNPRRSRSDSDYTVSTDVLSDFDEQTRGQSSEGEGGLTSLLSSVIEDEVEAAA